MWLDLYLVAAVIVAFTAWLVTPHFQSTDPPGEMARAVWSTAAGALWPLVVVGSAQVLAVRYVVRKFRSARVGAEPDRAPLVALHDVSLHS